MRRGLVRGLPLAALVLVLAFVAGAADLRRMDLPPEVLGEGWERSPGIRVDDLADLSGLRGLERAMAAALASKLAPVGVVGVADFSLVREASPSNVVTVRVYRFRDAEACRNWWRTKYRYDGWEEHYAEVAASEGAALDSRQMNKRAIAADAFWLTAHQLREGDEHLTALAHVLSRLR